MRKNHLSLITEKIAFKTSDLIKKSLVTTKVRAVQKSLLLKLLLQRKSPQLNANLITLSAVVMQKVKLQKKKLAVSKKALNLKSHFCRAKKRSRSKNPVKMMSQIPILTILKTKTKTRLCNNGCLLSPNVSKIWLKQ